MFDVESTKWTNFAMAGFFDGTNYTEHYTLDSLIEKLLHKSNRSRIVFAHNGGRFDFLFLFDAISKHHEVKIIAQGSRITALKIDIGDRHYVTLQDSIALFSPPPLSLEKLCETFNPPVKKLKGAIDFEKEEFDTQNPTHRQYLKQDCESLWHILNDYKRLPFIEDVGFKLTAASTAMAAWRTTLKKPIRTTGARTQAFVRKSYAGGRCEIFRQHMRQGHCYDANSLYPTMMLKPLPVEDLGEARDYTDFGFHEITVHVPDCYMPILWVKTPKLIFPTGTFRGVFFSEEIKLAVKQGAKILKYHYGREFTKRDDLFTDYINTCYKLRTDNPKNALNLIGKILMNSAYGKFAEREEKKSLVKVNQFDPSSWPEEFRHFHSEKMFKKTGLIEIDTYRRSPHMLCHISSAITAYGRIHMAEKIFLPKQNEIHYTDTDSAFINSKIPTGEKLGDFKEEYGIKSAFFLLPKGYWIEKTNGETIKKLKGFSKKTLNSITYDLFIKGNISTTEKRLAGFRSALIRENRYLALINQKKSVITEYNKRKITHGGETRPWHFKKGALL